MPKHSKVVPITSARLNSQERDKPVLVPIRNGSFVQISFSELLKRSFQQQEAQQVQLTRGEVVVPGLGFDQHADQIVAGLGPASADDVLEVGELLGHRRAKQVSELRIRRPDRGIGPGDELLPVLHWNTQQLGDHDHWHPGRDGESASQVTVTFTEAGAQTLVVIEHSGWEVFADPAATRAEYDEGWPVVLAGLAQQLLLLNRL